MEPCRPVASEEKGGEQMLTQNVAGFIRKTKLDSSLAEEVRCSDSYQALAELSNRAGQPASAAELKAAFQARNARVLARQMIRQGLAENVDLPAAQPRKQELWDAVQTLDLRSVTTQLVNRKGWSPDRVDAAVRRYRGFLYLTLADVVRDICPTQEVDEVWHQHILNTKQYAADCERLAGKFIHHAPASDDDSEAESKTLEDLFFRTWVAYESEFGEPYQETIGEALLQRWPRAGVS
jgi:hypothetical protein